MTTAPASREQRGETERDRAAHDTSSSTSRHLAAIASAPRPAGGEAEARARRYCAEHLAAAGFSVHEAPFTYSASVGRWGMPVAGMLWVATLGVATAVGAWGHPLAALGALGAFAAALPLLARWATRGVLRMGSERRAATNLVATRGDAAPDVWLVAHLDSKSQPVPMVARVVGVGGSVVVLVVAALVAVGAAVGAAVAGAWLPLAAIGVVLALPVIASVIGARSPGALDNASGVVAVLLAASEALDDVPPLPASCGVLLTSAEELGLAGARAWADQMRAARPQHAPSHASAARRAVALNVDGVDDGGPLRVMIASPLPPEVERVLDGGRIRRLRVPPGVLVDAIALAEGGFAALTLSRGTLRTLGRIHTPHDSLAQLRGDGIRDAARLLRRLAAACALDRPSTAG